MDLLTFLILSATIAFQSISSTKPLFDVTSDFEWSKPMEQNKLGIFTRIMVHMEFKEKEISYLWRTNKEFTSDELIDAYHELCDTKKNTIYSDKPGDNLLIGNCTFSDNQVTAILEQGTGEPWNKNISYIEITTKPFRDLENICILNEFPYRKAYIVLITNVFGEDRENPIYKLDEFMPFAKSFFEEIIDTEKILQFYPRDFMNQKPQYKCFLGIATGEPLDELKKNCNFKCHPKDKKEKLTENRDEL